MGMALRIPRDQDRARVVSSGRGVDSPQGRPRPGGLRDSLLGDRARVDREQLVDGSGANLDAALARLAHLAPHVLAQARKQRLGIADVVEPPGVAGGLREPVPAQRSPVVESRVAAGVDCRRGADRLQQQLEEPDLVCAALHGLVGGQHDRAEVRRQRCAAVHVAPPGRADHRRPGRRGLAVLDDQMRSPGVRGDRVEPPRGGEHRAGRRRVDEGVVESPLRCRQVAAAARSSRASSSGSTFARRGGVKAEGGSATCRRVQSCAAVKPVTASRTSAGSAHRSS